MSGLLDLLIGFCAGVGLTLAAVAGVVHVKVVMAFHEDLHRIRAEIERRQAAEDRYAKALASLKVDWDLAAEPRKEGV